MGAHATIRSPRRGNGQPIPGDLDLSSQLRHRRAARNLGEILPGRAATDPKSRKGRNGLVWRQPQPRHGTESKCRANAGAAAGCGRASRVVRLRQVEAPRFAASWRSLAVIPAWLAPSPPASLRCNPTRKGVRRSSGRRGMAPELRSLCSADFFYRSRFPSGTSLSPEAAEAPASKIQRGPEVSWIARAAGRR